MKKELFCNTPDADRITIPYTRPPRTFPPGSDSEPEEDIEEMWRRSRRHIKVFPDGEKPRTLSRASSVATYQGSEADFKWDDVCDEVDTDELKRDRAEVADWLLCSDPTPWHSNNTIDTLIVPFTPAHVGGSLFLQLLHALFLFISFIPKHIHYIMPVANGFRKPDDPDHEPFPRRLDDDDSLRYVIRDRRRGAKTELISIMVTKDWSQESMRYQPKGAPRIYRVLDEHDTEFRNIASLEKMNYYVRDIPRPIDEFDPIYLERHGQPSKDIGPYEERWHLLCTDSSFLDYFRRNHRNFTLTPRQQWIRYLRQFWPWRKDRRTWVYRDFWNVAK